MPELLSIGNSFSSDAQRHLHDISCGEGHPFSCANLYIGGCSLERHYRGMMAGARDYDYLLNGASSGLHPTLGEALGCTPYKAVTLQQATMEAADYDTYQPYLDRLAEYVRSYQPKTQLYIHQTWSFEEGSPMLEKLQFAHADEMQDALCAAYDRAAAKIDAKIIPCGDAMRLARRAGLAESLQRDGRHASHTYGRYLLAATWYMTLTGRRITAVLPAFEDGSVPDGGQIALVLQATEQAVLGRGYTLA